jgi:myo-inositol 2-dehydrogenase/D-chiro-inositol 1-dehydrogenase
MIFPRIGVVGAGGLSSRQIYPNLAAAGLKLGGVCDLDRAKAQTKVDQYGGEVFDDFDTMLASNKLDGVILCVGPEFHSKGSLKALQAGLPVYTEKPPAICAADLKPVVALAREKNLIAMTAMKKRYADVYRRAKAFIGSPEFGTPQHLQMFRVSPFNWTNKTPRTDHLLDYGVHNIDLVLWLFGPVKSVEARTIEKKVYDITLAFESGSIGSLSFVTRPGTVAVEDLELTGSNGWMSIRDQSQFRIASAGKVTEIRDPNFSTAGADGGAVTGHRTELEAFAAALRDGTRPASHIEESYRTMCVYDAIVRAIASGKTETVQTS